jgi:hypothetical protein
LQLLLLYFYNSDEDEDEHSIAADDFLELLRLFQTHGFTRKVFLLLYFISLVRQIYKYDLQESLEHILR